MSPLGCSPRVSRSLSCTPRAGRQRPPALPSRPGRGGGGEHVVERLVMAPEAVQVLDLRGGEGRGRKLEQLAALSRGGPLSREPGGERFQGAPNLVGVPYQLGRRADNAAATAAVGLDQ